MAESKRISPEEAHKHLNASQSTMLVCAYEEQEKFQQNHLADALSLQELQAMEDTLPKDQEIIFYCA